VAHKTSKLDCATLPVGIGQSAARNGAAKSRVIQLRLHRPQTRHNVSQAFAKRELRESHAEKLVATREATVPTVTSMSSYATVELVTGQKLHELGKHQLTRVHSSSPVWMKIPAGDFDHSI
jgi:hypothetical protein